MKHRLRSLRRRLRQLRLDGLLVSNPANIYYISGFCGGDSYAFVSGSGNYIITDFRYQQQAENAAGGFKVISGGAGLRQKTIRLLKTEAGRRIGFESDHMSVRKAHEISQAIGKSLQPTYLLIERLRAIKDASETDILKKAAAIGRAALLKTAKNMRCGDVEKDIAARLDFQLRKNGADAASFETIVASGPNASMPHAKCGPRRIGASEPVILDCGARLNGYNSDLTLTHFVGTINTHCKYIYNIVASAQSMAIDKVAPGEKISNIDKAARNYIHKQGLGKFFGHATGHGIGIDVHELPIIHSRNNARLKEGMVFTIEPGVYIPGWGGVRIEDMVLVLKNGCRVLTR